MEGRRRDGRSRVQQVRENASARILGHPPACATGGASARAPTARFRSGFSDPFRRTSSGRHLCAMRAGGAAAAAAAENQFFVCVRRRLAQGPRGPVPSETQQVSAAPPRRVVVGGATTDGQSLRPSSPRTVFD